jgi:hypothetical protein
MKTVGEVILSGRLVGSAILVGKLNQLGGTNVGDHQKPGANSGRVSLRGIVLGKIPSARKVPTTSALRRNPQTLN